jgi:hypothetical protein
VEENGTMRWLGRKWSEEMEGERMEFSNGGEERGRERERNEEIKWMIME